MSQLLLVTPPSVEPIDLATAKFQCRVDVSDDDSYFPQYIQAAREWCENRQRRSYIQTTWDYVQDGFPVAGGMYNRALRQFYSSFSSSSGGYWAGPLPTNTGVITLPRPSLMSVVSISYYDSTDTFQTLSPSVYNVQVGSPGEILPGVGKFWPPTSPRIGAVIIRFNAGYGTTAASVPASIKQAMLFMIGHFYENREAVATGMVPEEVALTADSMLDCEDTGGYS